MLNTEGLCLGCMNSKGSEKICPICGFDPDTPNPDSTLPLKTVIKSRYVIGKAIKSDGEGITYLGWDGSTDTKVEIKEYFPIGFAKRNPDKTVSIEPEGKYTFNECLLEFIDINRTVSAAMLPALVKVLDVFEENGTAYSVREFVSGISLGDFLEKNGGTLKWEQARPLFLPLLDTVKNMHDMGVVHAGISTDTIIVGRDGKLRLSAYSVKKLHRADSELVDLLYKGFSACEQYGIGDYKIDFCTDVYGLCATLFRVFIGTVPPDAVQRMQNDVMTIPAKLAEELPRHVLAALANGLQVLPENRTPSVEKFKNELIYGEIADTPNREDNGKKAVKKSEEISSSSKKHSSSGKYVIISALFTVLIFGIIAVILIFTVFKDKLFDGKNAELQSQTSSIEAPMVESLGTVESGTEITAKRYPIPNLTGKYYSEILKDESYEMFEFIIKDKEFSNEYPKGTVCSQSVKAGTEGVRDTKIELVISLGPKELKIANVKGLDETNAKLELLKQGFLYENIKVLEKYDEDSEPGKVIEQSPSYGEKVSTDVMVEIYINTYEEDESSSASSENE